ncbi:MAG: hypothetical protein R2708_27155 [Vicinamibacterales bacterium]
MARVSCRPSLGGEGNRFRGAHDLAQAVAGEQRRQRAGPLDHRAQDGRLARLADELVGDGQRHQFGLAAGSRKGMTRAAGWRSRAACSTAMPSATEHPHVGDDDVERLAVERGDASRPLGAGRMSTRAAASGTGHAGLEHARLVVDEENAFHAASQRDAGVALRRSAAGW